MFGSSPFNSAPFGAGARPDSYKIPAWATEEGHKRTEEYFAMLGRFVDMFARVETAVTLTLWHYAGTTTPAAKIVFAGTKIEMGSTYIKQLAKVTRASQEKCDDLENVLQQLGIINGVRNAVLHYGTETESVAEGRAIVTDALRAKEEPKEFPISPNILGEMLHDLRKIITHLERVHLGRATGGALSQAAAESALRSPWRYKHPVPPQVQTKTARSRQPNKRDPKRPHQPQSSQE